MIIDIGSRYLRVGYSGDERPSVVICSSVGVLPDERLLFGDLAVACARDGLEVKPTVSCSESKQAGLCTLTRQSWSGGCWSGCWTMG